MRFALAFALLLPMTTVSAQHASANYGPAPTAADQRAILTMRESVWRAWFSNDKTAFATLVPQELVALSWSGGPWDDRDATMQRMQTFANGGQRIATLDFPRNVFQQYGDAVILYTQFRIVLVDTKGVKSETKGRGTEVFVKRAGKWIHTGWHLDAVAE